MQTMQAPTQTRPMVHKDQSWAIIGRVPYGMAGVMSNVGGGTVSTQLLRTFSHLALERRALVLQTSRLWSTSTAKAWSAASP